VQGPTAGVALPLDQEAARMAVVLSGYYGFDNFGDELILKALIQALRKRHCAVTVLSRHPERTESVQGVRSIHRYNLPLIAWALSRSRALISGGGGLFQDVTGVNSPRYYGGLILLARWLKKPVAHLFQSIGPLTTDLGRKLTAESLRACQFVAVRDENSAQWVERLTGAKPLVASDAVWLLPPQFSASKSNAFGWTISVSLRSHPNLEQHQVTAFAKGLLDLFGETTQPILIQLLACQAEQDEPILLFFEQALQRYAPSHLALKFHLVRGGEDIEQAIARSHLLFGMRYHSLVAGLLYQVPVYALIYDPKVQSLVDAFGLQGLPIQALSSWETEQVRAYFETYPETNAKIEEQRQKVELALNAFQALFLQQQASPFGR
jgi:polysaccharide pyruvyl transferase CsaB